MRYVVRGGCSLTSFLRMRLARSISVTPTILRILSVPIRARADSGSSPCRFGSPCRVIRGGRSLVGVRGAAAWISSRSNLASGPKAVGGRGDPDRAPESMPMRRLDRFPRDLRVDRLTLAASATSAAAASTAAFAVASSTVAAMHCTVTVTGSIAHDGDRRSTTTSSVPADLPAAMAGAARTSCSFSCEAFRMSSGAVASCPPLSSRIKKVGKSTYRPQQKGRGCAHFWSRATDKGALSEL